MNKKSSNYKCSFGHLSVFSERISLYPFFFFKAQIHKKVKTNNLLFYDSTSIFLWCFWHNPTPTEESFQPSDFYRLSRIYSQEHFPTPAGILRLSQASQFGVFGTAPNKAKVCTTHIETVTRQGEKKKRQCHNMTQMIAPQTQLCAIMPPQHKNGGKKKKKPMYCPLLSFPKK